MEKENKPKGNKKKLRPADVMRLQRSGEWAQEASSFRDEDQRALRGLQYQEEPIEDSLQELRQKMGLLSEGNPSRYRRLPVRLALVASFLLAIVAGYFAYSHMNQEEQLFAQHFDYMPSVIRVAGAERNVSAQESSLLASAVQAYETGAYKDAEGMFRAYLSEQSEDTEVSFYYALLQLGKGNAGVAVPILKEVAEQPPRAGYERAANWYLGLAQLKMDNRPEAIAYFEQLESGEDRFAKNARDVLTQMR
ncbi:MAG: hypothetical protein GVY26_06455 [Bacteroidetes bacterium]|jgi:TolA-binding protein|nr:hypothetical protein [Bacteroidota bacterium]